MKRILIAYVATGVTMAAMDSVWLTLAAPRLYRPLLGDMLLPGFNAAPAVLFYLLYIGGIVGLVVLPALATRSRNAATARGALLGLVAYGTYDLTNQATLKGWSTTVTVADLCWGTFLTAFAATIGYAVTRALRF
ncbi:MAG: DUF2177 family protein [Sphingomonadaceae bacterium]|nr:DUF2177 family protein [Sphingomonadaceae bacterium]